MLYESTFITVYSVVICFILGGCMGSFLNCMSWRIVHGEGLGGRSHCDSCGHVLGALDLIPILSYIINKGKCRYCGVKLSRRHLVAEAISAIVFVSILLKFNISFQALKFMLFACILLAASFADLEGYIIPDRFIISGIVVYAGCLIYDSSAWLDGLAGGVIVAGGTLIVVLIFEKVKGVEAMGGGDIKLLFVTGLFLGLAANVLCLILACLIGIIFGLAESARSEEPQSQESDERCGRSGGAEHALPELAEQLESPAQCTGCPEGSSPEGDSEEMAPGAFPWGPSIAIAAWISMLCGSELANWYLSLL
jgi:leader peptidase (prepilin peptidase) / N-methyltransferase